MDLHDSSEQGFLHSADVDFEGVLKEEAATAKADLVKSLAEHATIKTSTAHAMGKNRVFSLVLCNQELGRMDDELLIHLEGDLARYLNICVFQEPALHSLDLVANRTVVAGLATGIVGVCQEIAKVIESKTPQMEDAFTPSRYRKLGGGILSRFLNKRQKTPPIKPIFAMSDEEKTQAVNKVSVALEDSLMQTMISAEHNVELTNVVRVGLREFVAPVLAVQTSRVSGIDLVEINPPDRHSAAETEDKTP